MLLRCAISLLLAAAFAAGCDADHTAAPPLTKAQYERKAGAILRAYATSTRRMDRVITPENFDDDTQQTADALRALNPPPDVRRIHRRLVRGLDRLAADQRAAMDAIFSDDDRQQQALARLLGSDARGGEDITKALRALRAHGYRLPSMFGVRNEGPLPPVPAEPTYTVTAR